jgi:large subunit ribosomal protein L3
LPGRYGNERVTVKNLRVVKVLAERNLIFLGGAVPGSRGSLVTIRTARKRRGE